VVKKQRVEDVKEDKHAELLEKEDVAVHHYDGRQHGCDGRIENTHSH
jgi:hypothetical protein